MNDYVTMHKLTWWFFSDFLLCQWSAINFELRSTNYQPEFSVILSDGVNSFCGCSFSMWFNSKNYQCRIIGIYWSPPGCSVSA